MKRHDFRSAMQFCDMLVAPCGNLFGGQDPSRDNPLNLAGAAGARCCLALGLGTLNQRQLLFPGVEGRTVDKKPLDYYTEMP